MGRRYKQGISVDEHPVWSPSRLDLAEMCMKAYWLKYIKKIRPTITPSTARGRLIHNMIERFWKIDKESGLLKPKFSYEGFINSGIAIWKRFYASENPSLRRTDEIRWDFPGQQWSKHFLGELADILGRVYNRYITEEPRIAAEVELYAEVDGIKIMAIIDELRKDLVIRDHKSGYKTPSQEYLNKNIQMTDYLLCLYIALQDSKSPLFTSIYPDYAGITLDEFLKIATIEIHHLPDANRPYYSRKTGEFIYPEKEPMTRIYTAKRTKQNIEDFLETLRAKEKSLAERDFHPTQGRHCEVCFMKEECDKYDPKKEHENELERNMPLFSYANLGFGNMPSINPAIQEKKPRQKTFRFRHITDEKGKEIKQASPNNS